MHAQEQNLMRTYWTIFIQPTPPISKGLSLKETGPILEVTAMVAHCGNEPAMSLQIHSEYEFGIYI